MQPGPIVSLNAYELVRRASYWPPTRWILSALYRRHWNKHRGRKWSLLSIFGGFEITRDADVSRIAEALAQPDPLLTAVSWR
jgi:hypothetical protein